MILSLTFTIFTISFFLVFHAYFGYPLTLLIIRTYRKKNVISTYDEPAVTLIVTAYNEEKRIAEKLENTLQLDYPRDRLQIIVASDGSTDQTNTIVTSYAKDGISLLEVQKRGGKENAQKEAIACANGEIIVFSDVATIIAPNGLREILTNFGDPSVGCVSSEDRLLGRDGTPSGEGAYVRYEMWLRRLESAVFSLVGLSGSFFAARKEVCQDFSADVQSDFRTLLSSVKMGLRGVSNKNAIGYYKDLADEKKEFERKVRTVLRGLTVFFRHLELLNVFKYGIFTYQLICHKLLRWLVPFFLLATFISNSILALEHPIFVILFMAQVVFYSLALLGLVKQSIKGKLKIPMFFLVVNAAIFVAWCQYVRGKRVILWAPSQR